MKKLKEGGSLVETCVFGEPIISRTWLPCLAYPCIFHYLNSFLRKNNRKKLRVTWMNSLSLFATKKRGRRLGLTQRDASDLFYRPEQYEGFQGLHGHILGVSFLGKRNIRGQIFMDSALSIGFHTLIFQLIVAGSTTHLQPRHWVVSICSMSIGVGYVDFPLFHGFEDGG